jgi:hypothetical protein
MGDDFIEQGRLILEDDDLVNRHTGCLGERNTADCIHQSWTYAVDSKAKGIFRFLQDRDFHVGFPPRSVSTPP